MDIKHKVSSSFSVREVHKGKFELVKVIGEYTDEKEAYRDVMKLLSKKVTENELESNWRNSK